ncbi:MAG: TlyA family RNA methyltransferase [Candidatus Aquicultor sp.]|nr:TlyA family RNA methyltransferase [Candidatus Aquicultor sp.]
MGRKRADTYLVESGLVESREQAQRLIMARKVYVDAKPIEKPSSLVDEGGHITIDQDDSYVSRGGLKLEKALQEFSIDPVGKPAIDIGASTGGFTDCLLRNGAKQVVAIDVGYGQLAWSLRQDPRVIVLERTNIRHIRPDDIPYLADLITIDVSFISLQKILSSVVALLAPDGEIVALVKPQFEAGRERVGKKGVVKDPVVHKDVLNETWEFFEKNGMRIKGLSFSPIKGPEGNLEFLLYAAGGGLPVGESERKRIIDAVVEKAHEVLWQVDSSAGT